MVKEKSVKSDKKREAPAPSEEGKDIEMVEAGLGPVCYIQTLYHSRFDYCFFHHIVT